MTKFKNITLVHPSNELYGSDKMFLLIVEAIVQSNVDAKINVVLPCDGPLTNLISRFPVNIIFHPLGILRKAELKKLNFSVFYRLIFNFRFYHRLLKNTDLLYINTAVVLDFIFYSKFYKLKKVIHIHEIPTGLANTIFVRLIKFNKAPLIYISKAVQNAFSSINVPYFILPNGINQVPFLNKEISLNNKIKILLIGRINSWKGQNLLVEAISLLKEEDKKRVDVRIVGDVYGDQIYFKTDLIDNINRNNFTGIIKVLPFTKTPEEHYNWADLVVVPSLKPEPFGLVAIEGMSVGKLVIAANHGGLTEIIKDRFSGILFKPNSAFELSKIISEVIQNPKILDFYSANAISEYKKNYTPEVYIANFNKIIQNL